MEATARTFAHRARTARFSAAWALLEAILITAGLLEPSLELVSSSPLLELSLSVAMATPSRGPRAPGAAGSQHCPPLNQRGAGAAETAAMKWQEALTARAGTQALMAVSASRSGCSLFPTVNTKWHEALTARAGTKAYSRFWSSKCDHSGSVSHILWLPHRSIQRVAAPATHSVDAAPCALQWMRPVPQVLLINSTLSGCSWVRTLQLAACNWS